MNSQPPENLKLDEAVTHVDQLVQDGGLALEVVTRDDYNALFKDVAKGKTHWNINSSAGKKMWELMEELSKVRLSKNFIMRDFLHCNVNAVAGICNYPEDVEHVIKSGKALCSMLLEPVLEKFGRFGITYGYQNRLGMDSEPEHAKKPKGSSPHHWDRGTYGKQVYARVDIWPYCVEDGEVTKEEFGKWCMMNLDIDLFMMWKKANIFCITVGSRPRRVWLEWVPHGEGEGGGNRITYMGEQYWQKIFPKLPKEQRPKYYPSLSEGKMWLPK